jgi:hypothetical protein
MRSNFDLFAGRGDPWVANFDWFRESRLAINRNATTRDRQSAIDFVTVRTPTPPQPYVAQPVVLNVDHQRARQVKNLYTLLRDLDPKVAQPVEQAPVQKNHVFVGKDSHKGEHQKPAEDFSDFAARERADHQRYLAWKASRS